MSAPEDSAESASRHQGLWLPSPLQAFMVDYYERLSNRIVLHSWATRRLTGPVDDRLLGRTVSLLHERHSLLGARFVRDADGAFRVALDTAMEFPVSVLDLTGHVPEQQTREAESFIRELAAEPFDLSTGPLARFGITKLGDNDRLMTIVMHHAITDARSLHLLFRDFCVLHTSLVEGVEADLPALPTSFVEHVDQQEKWLDSEAGRSRLEFWKRRLEGSEEPFWLPVDSKPNTQGTRSEGKVGFVLERQCLERLRDFADENDFSMALVLYTAVAFGISRWSARSDIHLKILHSGRYMPQLYDVVGCFAGAWILRADLGGATSVLEALPTVRRAYLECLPHVRYPYARLRALLERSSSANPLLDISVNYVPIPSFDEFSPSAIEMQRSDVGPWLAETSLEALSGMKLAITFLESKDTVSCEIWYSWEHFAQASVERFCDDVRESLETIAGTSSIQDGPFPAES